MCRHLRRQLRHTGRSGAVKVGQQPMCRTSLGKVLLQADADEYHQNKKQHEHEKWISYDAEQIAHLEIKEAYINPMNSTIVNIRDNAGGMPPLNCDKWMASVPNLSTP
jgi:hypothetical protein